MGNERGRILATRSRPLDSRQRRAVPKRVVDFHLNEPHAPALGARQGWGGGGGEGARHKARDSAEPEQQAPPTGEGQLSLIHQSTSASARTRRGLGSELKLIERARAR